MADTRITKIQVRQGNIADLPILNSGEFGYALDEQRLFIGNSEYEVGTGNNTQVVFNIPIGADEVMNPSFFFDGVEVNGTTYSIAGAIVTFSTPPASGVVITMKWNTEFKVKGDQIRPHQLELSASANAGTETGFGFDINNFDTAFIDYSIKLAGGSAFKVGQLRIVVDSSAGTYYIDDQFNYLTGDPDIIFDCSITNDVLSLTYENNETTTATLYYTYKLWKM